MCVLVFSVLALLGENVGSVMDGTVQGQHSVLVDSQSCRCKDPARHD